VSPYFKMAESEPEEGEIPELTNVNDKSDEPEPLLSNSKDSEKPLSLPQKRRSAPSPSPTDPQNQSHHS
jgi:hypothetical protein